MVFIESRLFVRQLQQLAGDSHDEVLRAIQSDLLRNPHRGDLVRGLGGICKARAANPARGKGKRGGLRYLYLYLELRGHIHLLLLLNKNQQEDLSQAERDALRELVRRIKEEGA